MTRADPVWRKRVALTTPSGISRQLSTRFSSRMRRMTAGRFRRVGEQALADDLSVRSVGREEARRGDVAGDEVADLGLGHDPVFAEVIARRTRGPGPERARACRCGAPRQDCTTRR